MEPAEASAVETQGYEGPIRIEIPGLRQGLLNGLTKALDLIHNGYTGDRIKVLPPAGRISVDFKFESDSIRAYFGRKMLMVEARIIGGIWKSGWVERATITQSSVTINIDGLPDVELV